MFLGRVKRVESRVIGGHRRNAQPVVSILGTCHPTFQRCLQWVQPDWLGEIIVHSAHEIVSKSPNEEIVFAGVIVPCRRAEYLA